MGNEQSAEWQCEERRRMTELTGSEGPQDQMEEVLQEKKCLGCFAYENVVVRPVAWDRNFIRNCTELQQDFPWAVELARFVRNCDLPRWKYCKEVLALKREKPQIQQQPLRSQEEIEEFRKNLKKSVILSFANPRPEPPSRISTVLERPRSKIRVPKPHQTQQAAHSFSSKSRRSHPCAADDFVNETETEVSRQTAHDLEMFLRFSSILERHLNDEGCPLGRLRRVFVSQIEAGFKINEFSDLRVEDLVENVQQFLALMKEAVIDFYCLRSFANGQGANPFIANEENVLSACTAVMFRDIALYGLLFSFVQKKHAQRQTRFAVILDYLSGSQPQRFTVKDKFCLNARTLRSYLNDLNESGSAGNHVENIQVDDLMQGQEPPYSNCISQLRQMAQARSPINKMKAVMACSEGLTAEIERFYVRNGLKRQKWMLDADQVLSLFCYLLVSSRVPHLHSHLYLLDHFATGHQQISMTGYYLSVINCAVEQLEKEFAEQADQRENCSPDQQARGVQSLGGWPGWAVQSWQQ